MRVNAGWPRVTVALIMGLGFATVWGFLIAWIFQTAQGFIPSSFTYESLVFQVDGTPMVQISPMGQYSNRYYQDVQGNRLDLPNDVQTLQGVSLPAQQPTTSLTLPWQQRLRAFSDGNRPEGYWYLLVAADRADGYFVGYDSATRTRIGFLGQDGFNEAGVSDALRFPIRNTRTAVHSVQSVYNGMMPYASVYQGGGPDDVPSWLVYLDGEDGRVYQVDVQRRRARVAFDEAPVRSSGMVWYIPRPRAWGGNQLAVRTDDEVVTLDRDLHIRSRFPIPPEVRETGFTWGETTRGTAFIDVSKSIDPDRPEMQHSVYVIDRSGNVTARSELTLSQRRVQPYLAAFLGTMVPIPLLFDGLVSAWPFQLISEGYQENYASGLAWSIRKFAPALVGVHLLAVALAILCYRRQVRYGVDKRARIGWPLFVFIFGWPGWIAYRFSRWWPRLVRCPTCRQLVPFDRLRCPSCEAEYPAPEPLGIEVFA